MDEYKKCLKALYIAVDEKIAKDIEREVENKIINLQAELDRAKAVLKRWLDDNSNEFKDCNCTLCFQTREVLGINQCEQCKQKGDEFFCNTRCRSHLPE